VEEKPYFRAELDNGELVGRKGSLACFEYIREVEEFLLETDCVALSHKSRGRFAAKLRSSPSEDNKIRL
jgi:hypothetical protein